MPETLAPWLPFRDAVASGVALVDGVLVFRLDGGVPPGIYVQGVGERAAPRPFMPDPPGAFHPVAVQAGGLVAVGRGATGRIPPHLDELVFCRQGAEVLRVPGQSLAVSGDGRVAVVADVPGRVLRRVDLSSCQVDEVAPLRGGMPPVVPPSLSLDHDGGQALVMDCTVASCDGSLERVDLASGRTRTVVPSREPPCRVAGAFIPGSDDVVASQLWFPDGPRFRLLRVGPGGEETALLTLEVTQAVTPVAAVGEAWVVALLALEPIPGERHGPATLVAVSTAGGEVRPLRAPRDLWGRLRVVPGAVLLEGGPAVVRVPVTP
jgi:hypothetical protein